MTAKILRRFFEWSEFLNRPGFRIAQVVRWAPNPNPAYPEPF